MSTAKNSVIPDHCFMNEGSKDNKHNFSYRKISGLVFFNLNLVELSRSLSCSDLFCEQVLSRIQPFYCCVLSFQAFE